MSSISSYLDHDSHVTGITVTTGQRLVQRFLTHNAWLDFLKVYESVIYLNEHVSEERILGIHHLFKGVHAKKKVRNHRARQ